MDASLKWLGLFTIAVAGGLYSRANQPIRWANGKIIESEPDQRMIQSPKTWTYKECTFTPLAKYEIRARIVDAQRYYFDGSSFLSPIDFGVVWGPASDQRVIDKTQFNISDRFLWMNPDPTGPMSGDHIMSHGANMHLIPASDEVLRNLKGCKTGQGVELKGFLVEINRADGWHWKSSLSRTDTLDGACEVMWVESVRTVPEP